MKYALLADPHANLAALTAVLHHASSQGCDRLVVLGDLVGYGREPLECVHLIRASEAPCVVGNHDLACSLEPSDPTYLPTVERMFRNTSRRLDRESRAWLRSLPAVLVHDRMTLFHASLRDPLSWAYVENLREAAASFARMETPVGFFGHTHRQQVYVEEAGTVTALPPNRFTLRTGRRYLINPGSVGQPRDNDPRPAYATLDFATEVVEFHRLGVEAQRAPAVAAGVGAGLR